jgi:hypothetical protein
VSERTVARLLAQLRALGYVATRQTIGAYGETTGLRVALLDPLLPYWEIDQPPAEQEGVTELSDLQEPFNKEESKRLAGGYSVLAYPRYRCARGKKLGALQPWADHVEHVATGPIAANVLEFAR